MAECKFKWHVWDSTCKGHEPDNAKLYVRLEKSPRGFGIRMYVCDKDGKCKQNGNILAVDFQTQAILLFDSFSDKYGLKTDFDRTPLTCKEADWREYAETVKKENDANDDDTVVTKKVFTGSLTDFMKHIKEVIEKTDKDKSNDD